MLNVKPTVYTALSTDTTLKNVGEQAAFLLTGIPDGGTYPALTYSEISNVPALNADNAEEISRSTIQISVLTDGASTSAIAERVNVLMLGLGFMRQFAGI